MTTTHPIYELVTNLPEGLSIMGSDGVFVRGVASCVGAVHGWTLIGTSADGGQVFECAACANVQGRRNWDGNAVAGAELTEAYTGLDAAITALRKHFPHGASEHPISARPLILAMEWYRARFDATLPKSDRQWYPVGSAMDMVTRYGSGTASYVQVYSALNA